MRKLTCFSFFLWIMFSGKLIAQETLPKITVKNYNGRVIISWQNNYPQIITAINIQRSYDSLRNYTTIGSVLNPQNRENGYADGQPPYSKMYYRVFVSFKGGSYVFSEVARPEKYIPDSTENIFITNLRDSLIKSTPSSRIYTAKDNNVVICLPDALIKRYSVKFFDEYDQPLFELPKLTESYLIIEKVNFVHAGWFQFELYEGEKLIEKNKFYISKDSKL